MSLRFRVTISEKDRQPAPEVALSWNEFIGGRLKIHGLSIDWNCVIAAVPIVYRDFTAGAIYPQKSVKDMTGLL